MPSLSYKSSFVDYVEEGLRPEPHEGKRVKRQTIRRFRKHVIKKGDWLHHFYGLRTRFCRRLGSSTCKSCRNIIINHSVVLIAKRESGYPEWKGSYEEIKDAAALDYFANADGFSNWHEMKTWWMISHGANCFPFVGQLIKW
jgi:hypothetical protein